VDEVEALGGYFKAPIDTAEEEPEPEPELDELAALGGYFKAPIDTAEEEEVPDVNATPDHLQKSAYFVCPQDTMTDAEEAAEQMMRDMNPKAATAKKAGAAAGGSDASKQSTAEKAAADKAKAVQATNDRAAAAKVVADKAAADKVIAAQKKADKIAAYNAATDKAIAASKAKKAAEAAVVAKAAEREQDAAKVAKKVKETGTSAKSTSSTETTVQVLQAEKGGATPSAADIQAAREEATNKQKQALLKMPTGQPHVHERDLASTVDGLDAYFKKGDKKTDSLLSTSEVDSLFKDKDAAACINGYLTKVAASVDRDHANDASAEEVMKFADANNDGAIAVLEFYGALGKFGAKFQHDVAKTGVVQFDSLEKVSNYFNKFDAASGSADGHLDRAEMEAACKDDAFVPLMKEVGAFEALAEGKSTISIENLLNKLDGDGDGQISLAEFLSLALGMGDEPVKELDF